MKQLLPVLFLFLSTLAIAQAPVAQFASYEPTPERTTTTFTQQHFEVIRQINYLQDMPADKEVEKRKQAVLYVTNWMKSSPDVNLVLEDKIMPYLQYGESLAIFMGVYAQFELTHPTTDYVAANIAGVHSVISYYLDNKETLGFDAVLEKLVNMRDSGRLRGFLKRRIS